MNLTLRQLRSQCLLAALMCGVIGLAACPAPAAQLLWDLTPYQVLVVVEADDSPECTPQLHDELVRLLADRCASAVGESWQVQVVASSGGLRTWLAQRDEVRAAAWQQLPAEWLQADKLFSVQLTAPTGAWTLVVQELDLRTQQISPPLERVVGQRSSLVDCAVDGLLARFTPLALADSPDGKSGELRFKASALPGRGQSLVVPRPGTVLRPVLRFNDRDGQIRADRPPAPIPWTFLVVDDASPQPGSTATPARIYSGLRSPLSSRRRGRTEQLALVVQPSHRPTELLVQSRQEPHRPLEGYEVLSYLPPQPKTTQLGFTDWRGRLEIPTGDQPLKMLIIRHGGEFLARLPLVPGLDAQLVADLPDDELRLSAEGFITGLQDELIDLVARRQMLAARIRTRLSKGQIEDAQKLFVELRRLPGSSELAARLKDQRSKLYTTDAQIQFRIAKLFDDTQVVLNRALDNRLVDQIASEISQAGGQQTPPAAPGDVPAAPTTPPESAPVEPATPSTDGNPPENATPAT